MERPLRTSLAEQTADILRREILRGHWGVRMPGYRVLVERLGIGRPTVEVALKTLTEEGILLEPDKRHRRLINPDLKAKRLGRSVTDEPLAAVRIRVLASHSLFGGASTIQRIFGAFHDQLRPNWEFELIQTHAFNLKSPDRTLDRIHLNHPDSLWILSGAPYPVCRWAVDRGLKMICVGGKRGDLTTTSLVIRVTEIATDAVARFIALGHRRIVLPLVGFPEISRDRIQAALEPIFAAANIPFTPAYNLPWSEDDSVEVLWETLESLFRFTPPTAIISRHFMQYMTLVSFCAKRGIAIPDQLSAVVIGDDPVFPWMRPTPSYYDFSIDRFAKTLVKWVSTGGEEPGRGLHVVPATYAGGDTLAPAPANR